MKENQGINIKQVNLDEAVEQAKKTQNNLDISGLKPLNKNLLKDFEVMSVDEFHRKGFVYTIADVFYTRKRSPETGISEPCLVHDGTYYPITHNAKLLFDSVPQEVQRYFFAAGVNSVFREWDWVY